MGEGTQATDTELLRGWADRLQASARTGLFFASNAYDRERYQEMIAMAAEMAARLTGQSPVEFEAIWAQDTGYVTPRVGVGAAIFDADGAILLQKRTDSGLWALPVGFCEVGETPAIGIAREVQEEMGLVVRADRLIGVYDCRGGPWLLHHLYNIVFWCSVQGGVLTATEEAPVTGSFQQDALPELAAHHVQAIADAFTMQRGETVPAAFDRA